MASVAKAAGGRSDWPVEPLGALGRWVGGGTPSKAEPAFWTNGTVPWVSAKDMKTDVIERSADLITDEAVARSSAKRIPSGSVLCVMRSGILAHTFPVAVSAIEVTINQDLRALVLRDGVDPHYLAHFLRFSGGDILLTCSKHGTTVSSIEASRLDRYSVPLPDLETQRRIVARIDELFSELDDGEEELARARADLETYRKALLKAAVTGELTASWRAANEIASTGSDLLAEVLANRRSAWENAKRGRSRAWREPVSADLDALPELPSEWTWATLDQLCTHITSGSRAWAPYYDRGSCTFIMAQNVRAGRYDSRTKQLVDPPANDPERSRTEVAHNDLLLTIVGANTGDLCRVDFEPVDHFVCQSVALLRPHPRVSAELIEAFFAGAYGRQLQMEKMIYGQGRPHLSFDQIRSLAVPLPPTQEVPFVLHAMGPVSSVYRETNAEIDNANAASATLRQSILAAAFRGELVQ